MTVTALRPFTIGGSEIAAVCDQNPYLSALRVSARKLGLLEPQEESPAMRLGKELEAHILAMVAERGYEVAPAPAEGFADGWRIGHPDYFTVVQGERAVLEVKNVGAHAGWRDWTEGAPPWVQMQPLWYLALTGLRRYLIAALVGGERLVLSEGERNDGDLALMNERGDAFVKLLRRGLLAEVGEPIADAHAVIRELHPESNAGEALRANRATWKLVQEARYWKYVRDHAKGQYKERQALIEQGMGTAEVLISPHDEEVATFRTTHSRPLDQARLKAEWPQAFEDCLTTKTTRRFVLR